MWPTLVIWLPLLAFGGFKGGPEGRTAAEGDRASSPVAGVLADMSGSAQLLNISTRLRVQAGDNVLIGGFIVTGADQKKIIIRALGPSLGNAGVSGALPDPVLELHDHTGATIAVNDNWKESQQAEIEATGIPPNNALESAIVRTLPPGSYTAIVRGNNNTTGIGLVETYDLDQAAHSKLANISTRGFVETSDNVMIGGLITGPAGTANARVIVRGIGPSLTAAGVPGALQDPTLELHDGNGATMAANDNWRDTQEIEIEATGLVPTQEAEAAIVATVAPGNYTAIMRGKNNGTGVGLVETYDITGQDPRILPSPPKNVLVNNPTPDPYPAIKDFEPAIAVSGSNIVVGWNDAGDGRVFVRGFDWTVGYAYSHNRGVTFTDAGELGTSHWGADPGIAADRAGNFYFSRIDFDSGVNQNGDPKDRIAIYKSLDQGVTFPGSAASEPNTSITHDKPYIAVDDTGGGFDGNVYVCWTNANRNVLNIKLSRSTDGGNTFSNVMLLTSNSSMAVVNQSSMPAVGPDGEVYVSWTERPSNASTTAIFIRKSTDGGLTFSPATLVTSLTPSGSTGSGACLRALNGGIRVGTNPIIAVDKSTGLTRGRVYIAFNAAGSGADASDAYLTTSSDGGTTWSAPVRLNDDTTTADQWNPFVAVAPNGSVSTMWHDRRRDAQNALTDVFMAVSTDGGVSFGPNFRITEVSSPQPNDGSGCNYNGSYNGMAADAKYFYLVWMDGRMTRSGAIDPNIFFARVPVPASSQAP